MNETTKTTGQRDNDDELGPAERRKAAARILARGIRRLLTRASIAAGPAVPSSTSRGADAPADVSGPAGKRESVALPVVPRRALMSKVRAD
jgi:hypothetical protein